MLIGILQTGHAPDALRAGFGDYDDLFHKLLDGQGFTFRTWAVVDGVFPPGPEAADGWLITGSRHGAYEDHPWIPPLEDLIRAIHAANRPLVGICFGHQIIAQALGGRVEKYSGGWAVGRTEYDFDGETLALNAWHQDQVTVLPPGATVIASNDHCRNAGLVYGDRIFSVQPHPEFDRSFVAEMIEKRGRGLVPDPLLDAAGQRVALPIDDGALARRIGSFLKTRALAPETEASA